MTNHDTTSEIHTERFKKFKTDQEKFWAGYFGTEYIARNRGDEIAASNLAFFGRALRVSLPHASLTAIEINTTAAQALQDWMETWFLLKRE